MVVVSRALFIGLCLIVLSSCTSVKRLDSVSSNRMTFMVQGRSFDDIWDAAHKSLTDDLTLVLEDRMRGTLKATSKLDAKAYSGGEVVGIFITLMDKKAQQYWVAVVSEPLYQPVFLSRDWHLQVAKRMQAALAEPVGPAG